MPSRPIRERGGGFGAGGGPSAAEVRFASDDSPSIADPDPVLPVLRGRRDDTGARLSQTPMALRYVALGDSYTIGTAVRPADRWPDRLVAALADAEPGLDLIANLGVDGYTTDDLIRDQLPALDRLWPEFLSVLIGVNDVVRGRSLQAFVRNAALILDDVAGRVGPRRIVTVAVPDYTATPAGADYGEPRQRHAAIVAVNHAMAREAAARGIAFVDIFELSTRAQADRTLVANDGLHPSGRQYGLWVERIGPVVRRLLVTGAA